MFNLVKLSITLILIVIIGSPISHAQDAGNALFADEKWPEAANAYEIYLKDNPDDAAIWYQLAVSARQAERFSIALNALIKAEQLQFSPPRIGLERARLKVLANDNDSAVAGLRELAAGGFSSVSVLTNDAVLGVLAGHEGFDALVKQMEVRAYPCEHDEAFAEFDFWIGEWEVYVAGGAFAGNNSIRRAERGCVVLENWKSASGGSGSSINYVDKISGEWVQIWNSESGSQINIRGGKSNEGMLLVGTIHYVANGTTFPFRGLWTALDDGRVRQYFEQSTDEGSTWAPWFEGFYIRKSVN